ncbi:uncharacterized protein [Oscarella lobularis]
MALVTEVVLIVVISSSDLIHCEIDDGDETTQKIGLWTSRNDSGVVMHTMLVSLRPVLVLWFVASSSVLLGYFFMWAIRRCSCARSFQWMATAVGMAFVSEGFLVIASVAASSSGLSSIRSVHGHCDGGMAYVLLCTAAGLYVFHVFFICLIAFKIVYFPDGPDVETPRDLERRLEELGRELTV